LIVDASWKKFGKSEWNAIWLDKNKTTAYEIYQYFINTADSDLDRYLKILTLIEVEEIEKIVQNHNKAPEKREWQKKLAYEVVKIIHWEKEAKLAEKISDFMFGSPHSVSPQGREVATKIDILKALSDEELEIFKKSIWWFDYDNENFFETIVKAGLAKSNSEARNSVKSWAIYINEEKISDFNFPVWENFINDKFLFIRKGKKNLKLVLKK